MEKYGFVYIWFDRKHKRYYVGCHWGKEDDGYICSSSWMKKAYKRRPQDFKRKIIVRYLKSTQEMFAEEYRWLSLIKYNELGVKYYNLNIKWKHWASKNNKSSIGDKIRKKLSGKTLSEETKEKISTAMSGKTKTKEHLDKISKALTGKKASKESKEKNRQSHLGIIQSEDSIQKRILSRKGYKHSAETIEKIRLGNLSRKHKTCV